MTAIIPLVIEVIKVTRLFCETTGHPFDYENTLMLPAEDNAVMLYECIVSSLID
jgi:hypothetical protein